MTQLNAFLLVLDNEFRVENCNQAFTQSVGNETSGNSKVPLRKFVAQRDRKKVERWLEQNRTGDATANLHFNFLAKDHKYITVEATCLAGVCSNKESYAISALQESNVDAQAQSLHDEVAFLRKVIDRATEAAWCIEFEETVDLSDDENGIVRQVFENKCYLRLCNKAMMRLYDYPENTDISKIPVSRNFPRSRANERYVRGLIRERFHVDSARSIDFTEGGRTIHGDNSVRSDIVDNRLLRFWGTMHDVTSYRQLQAQMSREQRSLQSILTTIPEAILVVGDDLCLKGANPAYETLVDQSIDYALGKKVETLFEFSADLSQLEGLSEGELTSCDARSLQEGKKTRNFTAWVAPMSGVGADTGMIITLRPRDTADRGGVLG